MHTGTSGELSALRYLFSLGYSILGRNVKLGRDEIDLVLWDPADAVVVFAEVKSRRRKTSDFSPALRLTHRKKHAMHRAARKWIVEKNFDGGFRIDAVLVADGAVTEHYKEIAFSE